MEKRAGCGLVAQAFNSSTWEEEIDGSEASLVYKSRTEIPPHPREGVHGTGRD